MWQLSVLELWFLHLQAARRNLPERLFDVPYLVQAGCGLREGFQKGSKSLRSSPSAMLASCVQSRGPVFGCPVQPMLVTPEPVRLGRIEMGKKKIPYPT